MPIKIGRLHLADVTESSGNRTMRAPCDFHQAQSRPCPIQRLNYRREVIRSVIVAMPSELLSSEIAARRLGIRVLTLYDWLSQSDGGVFEIRGQSVTIEYYQGGRRGQGRIMIDAEEIERLLSLMRVTPKGAYIRKRPEKETKLQHITTKLGRADD